MAESQATQGISIDDQGRVVIANPQLAEALRRIQRPEGEQIAATNAVPQCGCNLVANCGGSLA